MVIRTRKHVTITEAHPYHHYVSDHRDTGGNAVVEKSFDPNCPLCKEEALTRRESHESDNFTETSTD